MDHSAASNTAQVVALLSSGTAYPDRSDGVEVVETHISWVFLTARFAYKLKKPVRFEFLDYTTTELRRRACHEEVRLNRRLAADVYLAVLPVTREAESGSLALDGSGEPIDWVVQMRRLPAEATVDHLLRAGRLSPGQVQAVARYFAAFYSALPAQAIAPDQYRRALEQHVRANGAELVDQLASERGRIRRGQSQQLRYVNVQAELLDARVAAGRVVDGHGDLRPEHIYLDPDPKVIDCIEFSEDLRTVDVADELSFLAMECERLGDGGLGAAVLAEYQAASGNEIPQSLLAFYFGYRAMVRAKVAVLRARQQPRGTEPIAELVSQYLHLAERSTRELGPPALLIVGGLMGTGKSTLAAKLADGCGTDLLATDSIRRALLGASEAPAAYGEGHYRPELREQVYEELFRQAEERLQRGESLVLDGTFLKRSLRGRAFRLADQSGAAALYVQCNCPRSAAMERIQQRADVGRSESEARTEHYDSQIRELEPPSADEPAVTIDTTQPLAQQLRGVFQALRPLLFAEPMP